ncbi:hypothetical protein [Streptomyces sp. NPDC088146]|uniref:hypothetical protein n=1 Tax=Streptomyces sp. NPDC088146 TaxID=3365829 RepID=UPI00381D69B0
MTGRGSMYATKVDTSPTGKSEKLVACNYLDPGDRTSGNQIYGTVGVDTVPKETDTSAAGYLAADVSRSDFATALTNRVTGVGDAATSGVGQGAGGRTYTVVLAVKEVGDQVAHVSVAIAQASPDRQKVEDLAREILDKL